MPVAESTSEEDAPELSVVLHAAFRGMVGAMAMTGMRRLTVELGLVERTPPREILGHRGVSIRQRMRRDKRGAMTEIFHWSYGAAGGAAFGALHWRYRQAPWAGPAYGMALWLGFEVGIAPLLGLKHARELRPVERLAFAADHLLYGLVLSEGRRRPQR